MSKTAAATELQLEEVYAGGHWGDNGKESPDVRNVETAACRTVIF